MTGAWGVAAAIIGSILGAVALLGAGLFAARATKSAARLTAEAQRAAAEAAAEPAQRQADLTAFREIRDEMKSKIARQDRRIQQQDDRIDTMSALLRAYSWTVDKLISRMRGGGLGPVPEDIHELVREHMHTGA